LPLDKRVFSNESEKNGIRLKSPDSTALGSSSLKTVADGHRNVV